MKTKIICSLLGLLFASTTLSAQTSVWKITKDRRTIYLGGTCQILRSTDYPLPKEFDQAFDAAPQVYFETDLPRLQSPEIQQLLSNRALSSDGSTLDKTLSPDSWKSVREFCEMAGIPEESMSKVRPWQCEAMLTSIELQKLGVTHKTMDTYFYQKTIGTPKVVTGLESVEQHIDSMTHLGAGRDSEMIDYSLKEISALPEKQDALIKAWKTGDLLVLDALLLKNLRQNHPALYREMVTERSTLWLPKIEELFRTRNAKFVLVNVKQLAGPEGLIEQLRQRGYSIEQLRADEKS